MWHSLTGSDFIGSVQTITFTSGSTSESVTVYIIDEDDYEGTENFYATLTTTESAVKIFEDNASITIIDDGTCQIRLLTILHV